MDIYVMIYAIGAIISYAYARYLEREKYFEGTRDWNDFIAVIIFTVGSWVTIILILTIGFMRKFVSNKPPKWFP